MGFWNDWIEDQFRRSAGRHAVYSRWLEPVLDELRRVDIKHPSKIIGHIEDAAQEVIDMPSHIRDDLVDAVQFLTGQADHSGMYDSYMQGYEDMDIEMTPIKKKRESEFGSGADKKRRKPPLNITNPDLDPLPHPDDPGNPLPDRPLRTMSLIAHSSNHDAVDLGTLRCNEFSFTSVDPSSLGPKNFATGHADMILRPAANQAKFYPICAAFLDNSATAGSAPRNALEDTYTHTLDGNKNGGGGAITAALNSADILNRISVYESLTLSTYETNSGGLLAVKDADKAIILDDQFLEFRFKNLSGVKTTEGATTLTYVTVYALKVNVDLHAQIIDASGTSSSILRSPLVGRISEGFKEKTVGALADAPEQPWYINIGDNDAFGEEFTVLDVKKFTLHNGQEGTLRAFINKPQYHNFDHWTRGQSTAGTLATDYTAVVHKAGETVFAIKVHGSVMGTSPDANGQPTSMQIEECQLGILVVRRFSYYKINRTTQDPTHNMAGSEAAEGKADED